MAAPAGLPGQRLCLSPTRVLLSPNTLPPPSCVRSIVRAFLIEERKIVKKVLKLQQGKK
jgi:hypothetical protein